MDFLFFFFINCRVHTYFPQCTFSVLFLGHFVTISVLSAAALADSAKPYKHFISRFIALSAS